ncbi:MAG: HEAT repeat domain-containing protein [candidate division WOR-3 bacterium]
MTGSAMWRAFVSGSLDAPPDEEMLFEMISGLDIKLFQLTKEKRVEVVKRLSGRPARQFPFVIAYEAGRLFHKEPSLWEEAVILLSGALPHLPRGERSMFFYFLFEAMEEGDERTRMATFAAIMKLGAEAAEFMPMIEGILNTGRPQDRKTALRVLLAQAASGASVDRLIERVSREDPDPEIRQLAARALAGIKRF